MFESINIFLKSILNLFVEVEASEPKKIGAGGSKSNYDANVAVAYVDPRAITKAAHLQLAGLTKLMMGTQYEPIITDIINVTVDIEQYYDERGDLKEIERFHDSYTVLFNTTFSVLLRQREKDLEAYRVYQLQLIEEEKQAKRNAAELAKQELRNSLAKAEEERQAELRTIREQHQKERMAKMIADLKSVRTSRPIDDLASVLGSISSDRDQAVVKLCNLIGRLYSTEVEKMYVSSESKGNDKFYVSSIHEKASTEYRMYPLEVIDFIKSSQKQLSFQFINYIDKSNGVKMFVLSSSPMRTTVGIVLDKYSDAETIDMLDDAASKIHASRNRINVDTKKGVTWCLVTETMTLAPTKGTRSPNCLLAPISEYAVIGYIEYNPFDASIRFSEKNTPFCIANLLKNHE